MCCLLLLQQASWNDFPPHKLKFMIQVYISLWSYWHSRLINLKPTIAIPSPFKCTYLQMKFAHNAVTVHIACQSSWLKSLQIPLCIFIQLVNMTFYWYTALESRVIAAFFALDILFLSHFTHLLDIKWGVLHDDSIWKTLQTIWQIIGSMRPESVWHRHFAT